MPYIHTYNRVNILTLLYVHLNIFKHMHLHNVSLTTILRDTWQRRNNSERPPATDENLYRRGQVNTRTTIISRPLKIGDASKR